LNLSSDRILNGDDLIDGTINSEKISGHKMF
jgi:hypothetical protein